MINDTPYQPPYRAPPLDPKDIRVIGSNRLEHIPTGISVANGEGRGNEFIMRRDAWLNELATRVEAYLKGKAK